METTDTESGPCLTESAVEQVKKLLARDRAPACGLRIAVTDGGCSGFSYKLDFDNEQRPDDMVLEPRRRKSLRR